MSANAQSHKMKRLHKTENMFQVKVLKQIQNCVNKSICNVNNISSSTSVAFKIPSQNYANLKYAMRGSIIILVSFLYNIHKHTHTHTICTHQIHLYHLYSYYDGISKVDTCLQYKQSEKNDKNNN